MSIAGHTFTTGIFANRCSCGRSFADIAMATSKDVGQDGYCHSGVMNAAEYAQIVEERERLWAAVMEGASA